MLIIAAKNAFIKNKTGVEEYTFRILEELAKIEKKENIIIYTNKIEEKINFPFQSKTDPPWVGNFHLKIIRFPVLWTQIGLSFQIIKWRLAISSPGRPALGWSDSRLCPSVASGEGGLTTKLFVPAHVMPLIHPRKTIVTIHGLEYEYFPKYYSWFSRNYLRWSTKYAVRHAWRIITVSENTKRDLIKLYKCDAKKITVIYHGALKMQNEKRKTKNDNEKFKIKDKIPNTRYDIYNKKYFLYLGRIELKKNVLGIVEAFKRFKIQDLGFRNQDYKLVLVGGRGYGYENVKCQMSKGRTSDKMSENLDGRWKSEIRKDIIFTGYVGDDEKWQLLRNAEALVFPSFYEGFGLPILEAQSVGVPVITSKGSSMEEITTLNRESLIVNRKSQKHQSALLVNPRKPQEIAEAMYRIISDQRLRNTLIQAGHENAKRFSWKKTARKTLSVLNF